MHRNILVCSVQFSTFLRSEIVPQAIRSIIANEQKGILFISNHRYFTIGMQKQKQKLVKRYLIVIRYEYRNTNNKSTSYRILLFSNLLFTL